MEQENDRLVEQLSSLTNQVDWAQFYTSQHLSFTHLYYLKPICPTLYTT